MMKVWNDFVFEGDNDSPIFYSDTEKYTIEETEFESTYTEYEDPDYWKARKLADVGLGGMTLSLGINYALGELPFNLFGFLDPFKKY